MKYNCYLCTGKEKLTYGNQERGIYFERTDGQYVSEGYEAGVCFHRAVERGQIEPYQYADTQQETGEDEFDAGQDAAHQPLYYQ